MDIPTEIQLADAIDAFRSRHNNMAPSRFGALAKGEPQFLTKLREGRSPTLAVARRVVGFMVDCDREAGFLHNEDANAASADGSPGNEREITEAAA